MNWKQGRETSIARGMLVPVAMTFVAMPAAAAEYSGYLTLTTDYVWRGVTQSDGDPAAQLGGEVRFRSGLYAGLWGSTTDINNGGDRQRDAEFDYYLGYTFDLGGRWALGATAVVYTYPGQSAPIDYDYEEYGVSVNYDDRVWLEYAYSPGFYGFDIESHNVELIAEMAAGQHLVVSGGVGYYDFSAPLEDAYAYWNLGLIWPVNRFSFDLRYHDTSDSVFLVSTPDRADSRFALGLSVSF